MVPTSNPLNLTDQQWATLLRFAKTVICEAILAGLMTAWSFFQSSGSTFITNADMFALVIASGTPIEMAAEKWLRWVESQP